MNNTSLVFKSIDNNIVNLVSQAKNLPQTSGVYLFKNSKKHILYIGKAKNLRKRVSSYFKKQESDWKINTIIESSSNINYIKTKTELEALLLEAELIRANQPEFNILLKSGQPFLYLVITNPPKKLPEIKIVRNKKEKGTYFGPFLEKIPARKVLNFLLKTFQLKLCNKKIDNGCLDFHLGICAGKCKPNFNKDEYLKKLELAKLSLKKGHKKFLKYLETEIQKYNEKLEFEKSKELYSYYQAFEKVFYALDQDYSFKASQSLTTKDIWIINHDKKNMILFKEKNGALKKQRIFTIPFLQNDSSSSIFNEYFKSYYQNFVSANTILINFEIEKNEKKLLEKFLKQWHKKQFDVSIIKPTNGHFYNLLKLAKIHTEKELNKQKNLSLTLKHLLKLSKEPITIDCFDISHKQGMFMVGSCIRFKNGIPDKQNFRLFKIKTVKNQNDYACLQEIVKRRYKDKKNIPDLILIDGGKGQLNSIQKILPNNEIISLAKRDETIFSSKITNGKKLNMQNYADQILISLRDYAHHFAITYHRKLSHL